MNSETVQDYITMSRQELKAKYGKELRNMRKQVRSLDFSIAHIPQEVKESSNKENWRARLEDRRFPSEYIESFMATFDDKPEKDKDAMLNSLGVYFRHKGHKLKPSDIKSGIQIKDITRVRGHSDSEILSIIELLKDSHPNLVPTLTVLETKVKSGSKDTKKIKIDIEDVLGDIDPRLSKSREKMYKYYRKKHKLFGEMKSIIKRILDKWEGYTEGEENVSPDRTRGDLDDNLIELLELYNKMDDDMNYIIILRRLKIPMYPDSDEGSSLMASNIIWRYLNEIRDEQDETKHSNLSIDRYVDDEPLTDEEQEYQTYMTGADSATGGGQVSSSTPQAETTIRQATEEDLQLREWHDQIDSFKSFDDADPLYALAADRGLIKESHTPQTRDRLIGDLKIIIEGLETDDPDLKGYFDELLDEMEELHDQVSEIKGQKFYLPLTESVAGLANKYSQDKKIVDFNYDKIESFHTRLVKTISELVEEPSDRTVLPYHWVEEDFADTKGQGEEQRKKTRTEKNILQSSEMGRQGKLRDLGDMFDDIMQLLEVAEEYYADPITDNMLSPFRSVPPYLTRRATGALTSHGKNNIAKLLQQVYIEDYTVMLTPLQLDDINDYREIINSPPSDRNFQQTLEAIEEILDILDEIFNQKEKDMNYFANRLSRMARKNTDIDLSQHKLDGKRINDLVTEDDIDGNYPKLIAMIYAMSSEMEKDANKKEQIQRFKRLHSSFDDKIKLSEHQEKLLFAYDSIRKMMDKPVYYGVSETDSFDNINDTIDIIKGKYHIELTANDIQKIVQEVDSLESLAKKHGTNEDVIYHVKAMFR